MKAPEFWKTYLGIALAGGLVAYVFLVEMKKEDKPEKTKEKVLTLDKAKVKELTLPVGSSPGRCNVRPAASE